MADETESEHKVNQPAQWPHWVAPPPRSRWPRRVGISCAVLVGGCGVALIGLLGWAQAKMDASGCGSVDPTDPMNYSAVFIRNDSNAPVVVDRCLGSYCDVDDIPVTLRPGQRTRVHAACGVSGPDMTSWRITNETHTLLGYIAVNTPRSTNNLVYPISAAQGSRELAATPAP
jgi:hypothetical protein